MVALYVRHLSFALCFLYVSITTSQIARCPSGWEENNEKCYKFISYPEKNYDDAMKDCEKHKATLVSVNNDAEHSFLSGRLTQLSPNSGSRVLWYTSGNYQFWDGDGRGVPQDNRFWGDNPTSKSNVDNGRSVIAYNNTVNGWSFTRTASTPLYPYICEIALKEAIRMFQKPRTYMFGSEEKTLDSAIQEAPQMLSNVEDTLIIGQPQHVFIECIAKGNPDPVYKWYRGNANGMVLDKASKKEVTTSAYPRYTLTNGRLTISRADSSQDADTYQCEVENKYGTLISKPISLNFANMEDFSNVQVAAVNAKGDKGTSISCPDIRHQGGSLRYTWARDFDLNFVQTERNEHMFISSSGKLYFSRVQLDDAGNYYCIVNLDSGGLAQGYIGSQMVVSRTSNPVELKVDASDGGIQKPEIQDGFIAVFPELPKVGKVIQLECFAFGTKLEYTWKRYDINNDNIFVELPKNHRLLDHNRILQISDVQISDSGKYECSVYSSESKASDTRIRMITIESPPFFTTPLSNQFVDFGQQLTWRVMASGIPQPTYTWYHNGKQLTNKQDVEINRNVIIIKTLDPLKHNGVYQCAASNRYGDTFSSAELRVMKFKPTFEKQVVADKVIGARNGIVNMRCNPEAAPFPSFEWTKNGGSIVTSDSPNQPSDRISLAQDGTLKIRDIGTGDQGTYQCTAKNVEGEASIQTTLSILSATSITQGPSSQQATVNTTTRLSCEASHDKNLDMIYQWYFNDRLIEFDDSNVYTQDLNIPGDLFINEIKYTHAGTYACVAKTQADSANRTAVVVVNGPPSAPAGVYALENSVTSTNLTLKWTKGFSHGSPVSAYRVEASTNFDNYRDWKQMDYQIVQGSDIDVQRGKIVATAVLLNPQTSYKFRVMAINNFGTSRPSLPSPAQPTKSAPPTKAPTDIQGGDGKVGVLTIEWKPLSYAEHHGNGIGYNVYYKKTYPVTNSWTRRTKMGQASKHVILVTTANSYQQYDVMVQAFNDRGGGPNSSVQVIYSAANMPSGTPMNPFGEGFNATALRIYWDKVNDTFDSIGGKLLGYKINYWIKGENEALARQAILPGQAESGLIIGLEPSTMHSFTVQVYNSAGNGPKSEPNHQSTFNMPPQLYPTEVKVNSVRGEPGTVSVRWRGVSTNTGEEPLQGYIVRYWLHGNDIRNATNVRLGRVNEAVVSGIKKDFRYELRILGYSRGGDGKMSMPSLTFILHDSEVHIDPSITEVLGQSSRPTFSAAVLILFSLIYVIL